MDTLIYDKKKKILVLKSLTIVKIEHLWLTSYIYDMKVNILTRPLIPISREVTEQEPPDILVSVKAHSHSHFHCPHRPFIFTLLSTPNPTAIIVLVFQIIVFYFLDFFLSFFLSLSFFFLVFGCGLWWISLYFLGW